MEHGRLEIGVFGFPVIQFSVVYHCTMYGVTKLVTEVTNRVTHERKFDGGGMQNAEIPRCFSLCDTLSLVPPKQDGHSS